MVQQCPDQTDNLHSCKRMTSGLDTCIPFCTSVEYAVSYKASNNDRDGEKCHKGSTNVNVKGRECKKGNKQSDIIICMCLHNDANVSTLCRLSHLLKVTSIGNGQIVRFIEKNCTHEISEMCCRIMDIDMATVDGMLLRNMISVVTTDIRDKSIIELVVKNSQLFTLTRIELKINLETKFSLTENKICQMLLLYKSCNFVHMKLNTCSFACEKVSKPDYHKCNTILLQDARMYNLAHTSCCLYGIEEVILGLFRQFFEHDTNWDQNCYCKADRNSNTFSLTSCHERHHFCQCDHNSSFKHLCACKICRDKIGEVFIFSKKFSITRREYALLCGYVTCNEDELHHSQSRIRRELFHSNKHFNFIEILHIEENGETNAQISKRLNLLPRVTKIRFSDILAQIIYFSNVYICTLVLCRLFLETLYCIKYRFKVKTLQHENKENRINFLCLFLLAISSLPIASQIIGSKKRKYQDPVKRSIKHLLGNLKARKRENIKEILYDIIYHRNLSGPEVKYVVYPVSRHSNDVMSHELLRVGSFYQYPSENSPSLIRLAEAGFYYEGKGRQVVCFSCGVTHDDWVSCSVPLDVHRQISPQCPYLKGRFPVNDVRSGDFFENSQCGTNGSPNLQVSDAARNIDVDAVCVCTDSNNNTRATLLVSSSAIPLPVKNSIDSGFGGSLSFSGISARSAPHSSLLTSSSRSSGYDSGYSSNQSASSAISSQPSPSQLPVISEERQQNIATRNIDRDCSLPINRNNTPKEKYPEYILIERRRATYKNWPPNLNFLHPLDLSECGFFYSNFGDCVRCFHCGIGLRNWESDDNPWVEHARWSRKCPYLLQRKGQEFIDSVLRVLGLQTDAEIEQQINNNGHEPSAQASSAYGTGSDLRDPIKHPSAQYVIQEKIFGDNKDRLVKKTMNRLLQIHDWDDITNDMLVNAVLEHKDDLEFMETETNQENLSEAKSRASASKSSVETKETDENNIGECTKDKDSTIEDPEKIQKENEELKDLYTCKICLDERVGITFVPCGHLVTCRNCSPKIKRCPLCRTFIRGTIKTTI